jgi:Carboxypeptidase regulatory-like domain
MPAKHSQARAGMNLSAVRFCVRGFGLMLVLIALAGVRVSAQSNSSVTGLVTDSSGGVVIGADVKLTDAGAGYLREAKTNGSGVYEFLQVPPGPNYSLSFSKDGFR